MAIYSGDQPQLTTVVINGVTTAANATVMDALPGEFADYQFSANYPFIFGNRVLSFRAGATYSIDPALLAALNASGAPITAV